MPSKASLPKGNYMNDIIVYKIVPTSDAVDISPDGQGGAVVDKKAAHELVAKDSRYHVAPIVVDPEDIRKQVLSRLTPVEKLFSTFEIPRPQGHR